VSKVDPNSELRRKNLYLRLLALSLDPADQVALLPREIRSPDEFAEEFDTELGRIKHFGPEDLTPDQMRVAEAILGMFNSMTASGDDSIWEIEALSARPEWSAVRDKAKQALVTDEWPPVDPRDLRMAFGDPADEEAYERAITRLTSPGAAIT
jgi:hypothetical protein